ncbi:MAG TPA: cupredoxin domain-containing protein [Acidobacteriaceae bacterium]|jgi:cytochrome c oxidase subunit 2|nr:cupredoxin domain-containing protein [Acidobacteriaceae bacterium]
MRIIQVACAAVAFAASGFAPAFLAGPPVPPKQIDVVAKRFAFEPADITVKKGEPVELVLKSDDVPHGLKFKELNVEVKAGKGKTGEVEFTPEQTGDFVGHCSVFCGRGHGSMSLTLHVVQ